MIRVLHVVENFNGQAVESWLSRVVCHDGFDWERLRFDFFLIGKGPGKNADLVRDKGCQLHFGNPDGETSLPTMAGALRRVVKSGVYDFVHIHQDVMAGVFAIALLGTKARIITQAHNCWLRLPVGGRLKERILASVAKAVALRCSKAIVGVSREALQAITRGKRLKSRLDRVVYCSAKLGRVAEESKKNPNDVACRFKEKIEIPADSKILLFLGRLDEYKNPIFALDVLDRLHRKFHRDVFLVIAGTGELDGALMAKVDTLGLADRVRMLSWVEDITPLLLAADLLLMPSSEICSEGLGLAAVEAQAHGLPVLASLSIPEDASIDDGLFFRETLSHGAEAWADRANIILNQDRTPFELALQAYSQSPFTTDCSYRRIVTLYQDILR